jgi:TRAP-type uncharacterized transport system substrate-binding protein
MRRQTDRRLLQPEATTMKSLKLPRWLRFVLVVGVVGVVSGAGLLAYRYWTSPVTLSVAVGSIGGEAAKAVSAIASRLASNNASVRLNVVDSGTALGAAKAFSDGKVDLAVVRGDVGDLSKAQAVVVVSHMVALIIAPPGSSIEDMDKLKGNRIGVIGGDANTKIVDVLSKEYGLDRTKVFKDIALPDARRAIQSKEVGALLIVMPLAEKYLSMVRDIFQQGPKALPILIPIESAGAIAASERAYESFDVPKGTLRGAPPVPDADVTTLRTNLYLVAGKALGTDLITTLTQTILSVRRDLMHEEPIFAQITAPSTDQDAYLPLHRGAAAVYNSTTQSFMDEYGNWIYLTPMLLGGIATVLAAGWKFLGIGNPATNEGPLDSLYALGRRIRNALTEAELLHIEDEIDDILKVQREKSASGEENAVDDATLNVAAHRLESLIHDRRTAIGKRTVLAPAA